MPFVLQVGSVRCQSTGSTAVFPLPKHRINCGLPAGKQRIDRDLPAGKQRIDRDLPVGKKRK
jgi:hypothetical protein